MTNEGTPISLSDKNFRQIVAIAANEAGLAIPEAKKSLVQSRIARRMRQLGIADCGNYLSSLAGDTEETQHFISALTTNVSHFHREDHHFGIIRDRILGQAQDGRLRFWSAGCSNGQEPYTLAMEILKAIPSAANRDILILATDIDRVVLTRAKSGIYSENDIEGVPVSDRAKFFKRTDDGRFAVTDDLKRMIRFRNLNLNHASWPMDGPFDAILCRNVLIYFSDETQSKLWPRFHRLLKPGGFLMLGHSERIHPLDGSGFVSAGVTTYEKT
ncbi:MAG: protein-glutamate O-methyltransferase CheR [Silicimonas sp.]|nr:protein-glutamate O-methyltransferase CheR [Silicimonas sp.]